MLQIQAVTGKQFHISSASVLNCVISTVGIGFRLQILVEDIQSKGGSWYLSTGSDSELEISNCTFHNAGYVEVDSVKSDIGVAVLVKNCSFINSPVSTHYSSAIFLDSQFSWIRHLHRSAVSSYQGNITLSGTVSFLV